MCLPSNGLLPNPDKVSAINDMPAPEDKNGLHRFLDMTNYLSRYVKNYSDKTSVLRELLHDDVSWHWETRHDQAFQNLKDNMCKPPVLAYCDVHKPVTLTCDSSKSGLGAAILQYQRPIAYASRALITNEVKWAQIEKKIARIVFVCTNAGMTTFMAKQWQLKQIINHSKAFSRNPSR